MDLNATWKRITGSFANPESKKGNSAVKPEPTGIVVPESVGNATVEPVSTGTDVETVTALTKCIFTTHGLTDPKQISYEILKTLQEYYAADFVGVLEIDLDLDLWYLRWAARAGNDSLEDDDSRTLIQSEEFAHYAKSWIHAFQKNEAVLVEHVELIRESHPEEYALYTRLKTDSIIGIPFYRKSKGFIVVRNPRQNFGKLGLIRLSSYVLMMELNEYKMQQSLRLQAESFHISDENEIRLDLFDGLRITHIGGQYQEENFSPEQRIVLSYMALYPKTLGARGLENRIWEDDEEITQEGQKVRRAVNGINGKCSLLPAHLICHTNAGYQFSPSLKVIIDVQEFLFLSKQLKNTSDDEQRRNILEDMVALYKGSIHLEKKSPGWMIQDEHHLQSVYLTAITRLLHIYFQKGDYESLHRYAERSMELVSNNAEGYYWKIRAYRKTGKTEKANRLLETAQKCLVTEEFEDLVLRLERKADKDQGNVL